jgi:hypothetical protein
MFPLRSGASRLLARLSSRLLAYGGRADRPVGDYIALLNAVHHAQSQGMRPTLRDLHKISAFEQTTALRLVSSMEREGLVVVDLVMHDRLASTVTVTPAGLAEFGDRFAA